jgi:flagellar basal body P-ring protein FlgI
MLTAGRWPTAKRSTEQGMKPCRVWVVLTILAQIGCAGPALRTQGPDEFAADVDSSTRLIGEVARPYNNNHMKLEAVALVTGLAGTGEDPSPSPQRAVLLHEMQAQGVVNPNQVLASPNTTLVVVRGYLPPGSQKGDKFDLEVQVPSRGGTKSLRGGFLMECRLTELAVLGNQIRDGHLMALGQGPILVDPSADAVDNPAELIRGRVLGGGVALKSRPLGLVINPDDRLKAVASVRLSAQIGESINRRFHMFKHGVKEGVAKPTRPEFVELAVHPRYKDNIARYVRVVRAVPIKESVEEQAARMQLLERQLLDPITAATAALRLEAIGRDSVKTLAKGIESKDPEVRFYAAEALAYLDETQAAAPLAKAARNEPAFRAYCLAALSAMDDVAAYDELRELLSAPSAETRYGAFRALWAMDAKDSLVKGETLGGQFSYHVLNTGGPPMIHVTRSYRPEIVVFGHEQRFETPLTLEAGNSIMVNADEGTEVTVSKFSIGQPDQKRVVSNKVDDVIRAIVELGGTYPDVVLALQQAKTSRSLVGRFEVDALPNTSRNYHRKDDDVEVESDAEAPAGHIEVANPLPELFSVKRSKK